MTQSHELLNPPQEVVFYYNRLRDLVDLRQHIDSGLMPVEHWGGLPVHGEIYHVSGMKGLRHGVLFSIMGTYKILKDMGHERGASGILEFDRSRQK